MYIYIFRFPTAPKTLAKYEAVINGKITDELIKECKIELEKLNERSAAALAKSKTTETYKENKVYEERICKVLDTEPITVDELGERIQWPYSRQRLTAVCTNLVRERRISVMDVKIKGKGVRKAYHR